jgi:hypothetical protein
MTTYWHLVVAVCFFMPLAGAVATATAARATSGAYVLVIALALALGFAFAWALQLAGAAVGNQMCQHTGARQRRLELVLHTCAVLWMAIALFLGIWLSSTTMQYLS